MGKDVKSKTEKETFWEEAMIGTSHFKTTIYDCEKKAEGRGNTPEESQKVSSEKWESGKVEKNCYLTTACTEAMGLPDNCEELETLRFYRDNFLMNTPYGRKAVFEYYGMAPKIIQAVEERGDAEKVWPMVYSDIVKAVSLVMDMDFKEAFEHYQKMTLDLKENYLN